ncbi:sodium/calcium exchanger 1-like isoform X2 [Carassius carassius]|uniref:sodium/calcium exchanger 1-like isoform X2 n=1 Tax=Carassius carassius TaxID=217509 RepID=UPI002868A984|nr:sodium/calcium exchanger 1-like isoform X2 [Carassius carassius]
MGGYSHWPGMWRVPVWGYRRAGTKYLTTNMGQSGTSSYFSLAVKLSIFLLVFSCEPMPATAGSSKSSLDVDTSNENSTHETCGGSFECKEGVILPIWMPDNPSFGDKLARATVYFVGLFYMFLGVSIIADRFMASIEVITSQEKEITIKKPNGETTTTTVRIWNETVSNLTLMALGSSAPEILLSVVEVCGHNFDAGELGPNTIVGSAAFNMFVIIGFCVSVIPEGEHRKVKHLRVFFVTATWSIFAYIWLYLILAVISPGIVEIWEGLLTLFFFPICVLFAWVADRRLLIYKYMYKRYRVGKQRGMIIETEGVPELQSKADIEMDGGMLNSHGEELLDGTVDTEDKDMDEDEDEARREMARILKELKQKHPEKEMEKLAELANYHVLSQQQKSRAFYRCQATRLMTGAGNILKKHAADQARKALGNHELRSDVSDNDISSKIFFDPGTYQCLENCGTVALNVVRRGGDLTSTVSVEYRTEDGTANAGSDYQFTEGVIVFKPGETEKEIRVDIIDDDIFEEDEHFLVHLSNVKVISEGTNNGKGANRVDTLASLGLPSTATVTIFDDDHAGIFTFEDPIVHVSESIGMMEVKVARTSGARGVVVIPYKTIEGTAKGGGEDFEDTHGVLEFQNDEISKTIQISIIDDEEYEKNKNFFLEIGEPQLVEMSERKAMLLHECGGFVKTGRDVYRKVQGRDKPIPSTIISITEDGEEENLTKKEKDERRIAEMGRPTLGEHVKLEVIIEESYEFKSTVDKLIKKTNLALLVGTNSWRDQFVEAITVSSGDDDDNECGEEKMPSCFDYFMHFLTVFWKVLFAFVPPTDYWNGWACFIVSIVVIGILTAFIGDLASHFGCTIGLKDSVTAVVFVALGTSVPDTFASKVAAIQDQYADASIGNVTGSNAVNVFLGIGLAWSIAAIFHQAHGQYFRVDPGTLAFSVTVFTIFAFICIAVLMYRRRPEIGGELGGPQTPKILTTTLFFSLWLMYIILSSMEAYCIIKGF